MRRDHRHCQPFAVPNRETAVPVASLSSVLGGSEKSAFIIPFLPFEIEPFRPDPHADQSRRGALLNDGNLTARTGKSTARGGNVSS